MKGEVENKIKGFLYGIVGHTILGWNWRAISVLEIESRINNSEEELKSFFGTPDDNTNDDIEYSIPSGFESSALIGGKTILHVYKKFEEESRNLEKYILRFTPSDGEDETGHYKENPRSEGSNRGAASAAGITEDYGTCFQHIFDDKPESGVLLDVNKVLIKAFQASQSVSNYVTEQVRYSDLYKYVRAARKIEEKPPLVFVSYRGIHKKHVDEINEHLSRNNEDKKFELWIDTTCLDPGDDFSPIIRGAVRLASIVIVVLSPDYYDSKFITDVELPIIRELCANLSEFKIIPVIAVNFRDEQQHLNEWAKNLVYANVAAKNKSLEEAPPADKYKIYDYILNGIKCHLNIL